MKYFVVSDIHSFYNEFIAALNDKGFEINNPNHKLVVCGDIFDRGPDAVKLYNYLRALDNQLIYIRGNHEDLLMECLDEIYNTPYIQKHHVSNGTLDTVIQFVGCSIYDFNIIRTNTFKQLVKAKMQPITDWINEKSINYYEAGKYIFVHGWVPCVSGSIFSEYKDIHLAPRDWWDDNEEYNSSVIWESARWLNGMRAWKQGARPEGKTVVCGHWHCSYGWSHIKQMYKEFPHKTHPDFEHAFEPFVENGIIAVDACTAYSGRINCVVLEVE